MHLRQRSRRNFSLSLLLLSLRLGRIIKAAVARCKEPRRRDDLIFPAYTLVGANPSTFFQFARRALRVKQEKVRQDLLPTYYFPARAVIYSRSARGDKLRSVRALTNCGGAERTVNNIKRCRQTQFFSSSIANNVRRWIINKGRIHDKFIAGFDKES